jgi:hypothetical protein
VSDPRLDCARWLFVIGLVLACAALIIYVAVMA